MTVTPFRYPGSKNKLLPQILASLSPILEKSNIFADIFTGGGSVALEVARKYSNSKIILNDKDYFIFCFWKIVSSNNIENVNKLCELLKTTPTLELYFKLRGDNSNDEILSAYKGIFFNRTSFSGDMRRKASPIGGKNQSSIYKINCRYNANKIIEKIKYINNLLRNRTEVYNNNVRDCSEIENKNISLYLDPPYIKKGSLLYEEQMSFEDHKDLSVRLKNRHNWILSYDNCDEVNNLYSWAKIQELNVNYCIKGKKNSWNKTTELLISNS